MLASNHSSRTSGVIVIASRHIWYMVVHGNGKDNPLSHSGSGSDAAGHVAAQRTPSSRTRARALQQYLEQQERPLPRSIGIAASRQLDAADTEAWLEEHWRPD